MLRIFRAMMPKEEAFLPLFTEQSKTLLKAAEALQVVFEDEADLLAFRDTIATLEHQGDDVTRKVMIALHTSYIVPFGRSDIQRLAKKMDDVLDELEDFGQNLVDYHLDRLPDALKVQAQAVLRCAQLTATALPLMEKIAKNADALRDFGRDIGTIEHDADQVLRQAQHALRAAVALDGPVTHREIYHERLYNQLEHVVDLFQDIADTVTGIVVETV